MIKGFAQLGLLGPVLASPASPAESIVRGWDQEVLAALRTDAPTLPLPARNLFRPSVAMSSPRTESDPPPEGGLDRAKNKASKSPTIGVLSPSSPSKQP